MDIDFGDSAAKDQKQQGTKRQMSIYLSLAYSCAGDGNAMTNYVSSVLRLGGLFAIAE